MIRHAVGTDHYGLNAVGTVIAPILTTGQDAERFGGRSRGRYNAVLARNLMKPTEVLAEARRIWDISRGNFDLWLEALVRPRNLLARWDRDSSEMVRRAAEFSVFPVILSLMIDIPYFTAYMPSSRSATSIAAYYFVVIYVQVAIWSIGLLFVGRFLLGKASLRDCIAVSLVFTAYWPVNEVLSYLFKSDKILLCSRVSGTLLGPQYTSAIVNSYSYRVWTIASIAFGIYFLLVAAPAIKYIHRVGTARALVICLVYGFVGLVASDGILKPVFAKMYNACPEAADSNRSTTGRSSIASQLIDGRPRP
jgi:hypothetical protein